MEMKKMIAIILGGLVVWGGAAYASEPPPEGEPASVSVRVYLTEGPLPVRQLERRRPCYAGSAHYANPQGSAQLLREHDSRPGRAQALDGPHPRPADALT